MVTNTQIAELVKRAREEKTERKFTQSAELTIVLKDIDVKKGFNLNEVVALPHKSSKVPSVCVVATGDIGTKARKAGIDRVMEPAELDRLGTNKREARKLVRA